MTNGEFRRANGDLAPAPVFRSSTFAIRHSVAARPRRAGTQLASPRKQPAGRTLGEELRNDRAKKVGDCPAAITATDRDATHGAQSAGTLGTYRIVSLPTRRSERRIQAIKDPSIAVLLRDL